MPDSMTKADTPYQVHIDIDNADGGLAWSRKFYVTPELLKASVALVGTMAEDVEYELMSKA
jgi:hypothetical protein